MKEETTPTTSPNKIWSEEYVLGIKEIDAQHEKFVKMLGDLYLALHDRKEDETRNSIFEELYNYIKYHLATEEKYFDKFNYEGAEEHKKEHEKFREKVDSFAKNKTEDNYKTSIDLLDFMENWLIDHVNDMDKKYVKCFKDNGLK